MLDGWFVKTGEGERGPLSWEELKRDVDADVVRRGTLIRWRIGRTLPIELSAAFSLLPPEEIVARRTVQGWFLVSLFWSFWSAVALATAHMLLHVGSVTLTAVVIGAAGLVGVFSWALRGPWWRALVRRPAPLATLLLLLPLSGCSTVVPMSEIAIDPALTMEEQAAVIDAAGAWFAAVPAARVPLRIGEDRGFGYVTRGACPGVGDAFGATELTARWAPVVRFCREADAAKYRVVMRHELGHALALRRDHLSGDHVMAAPRFGSEELTSADVEYLAAVIH